MTLFSVREQSKEIMRQNLCALQPSEASLNNALQRFAQSENNMNISGTVIVISMCMRTSQLPRISCWWAAVLVVAAVVHGMRGCGGRGGG